MIWVASTQGNIPSIPALEPKLVGRAGTYSFGDRNFIEDSYGFRPGRGCHDALRALKRKAAEFTN